MEINVTKILNRNIAKQIQLSHQLKSLISNICQNDQFEIGNIQGGKLNIHTSPHNLSNLRKHQEKILYCTPEKFSITSIKWRSEIKLERKKNSRITRKKPETSSLKHIAEKCKNEKLRLALINLHKTLSNQTENST